VLIMLSLSLVTFYALACSGKLEYELGAYQEGNSAAAPSRPAVDAWPATAEPMPRPPSSTPAVPWDAAPASSSWDAGVASASTDGPTTPATTTGTPPPTMGGTPPATTSACPDGVDALSLLATKCGDCHGEKDRAKGLDLASPGLAARTVGVKSTCNGKLLLDPMAATPAGQLLDKLRGPVPGCGAQMPYAQPPLSEQERACVLEWADKAIARTRSGS
jgi:hypothetical protein